MGQPLNSCTFSEIIAANLLNKHVKPHILFPFYGEKYQVMFRSLVPNFFHVIYSQFSLRCHVQFGRCILFQPWSGQFNTSNIVLLCFHVHQCFIWISDRYFATLFKHSEQLTNWPWSQDEDECSGWLNSLLWWDGLSWPTGVPFFFW